MAVREVQRNPNQSGILETIREDILSHSVCYIYEVLFIAGPGSKYDYQVTFGNVAAVSKDPEYINRCIIQALLESRNPRQEWFPDPQPFKVTRIPKESEEELSQQSA